MSSKDEEDFAVGGSQKVIKRDDKFTTIHMVAFVICTVCGREYIDWQPAQIQGFGQFMVSEIIVAVAFIVLFLCLAEIWSAIPFSGGAYGLARAVIGFYPGFLVGIAEVFTFIIHSAVSAQFLAVSIMEVFQLPKHSTIGIIVAVYVLAVALAIQPSTVVLRRTFIALAAISVFILAFWLFGSLGSVHFVRNASLHHSKRSSAVNNWFDGGMSNFMFWLPYASLPYAGACSFVLMTAFTKQPKQTMPRAVSIGSAFIFCLNIFVVFVNAGLHDNLRLDNPMLVGWRDMFKMTFDTAHHMADLLTFPAAFAQVFAYLLPCGALLQSLGRTNLLPSFMGLAKCKDHTRGTIMSAFLGFLMCLLIHFEPQFDLYSLCLLCTVIAKVPAMCCYIKLKWFCPTLERGYTMPLGIPGTVFVIIILVLLFIASAFCQHNYLPIFVIAVAWVGLTIYYYGCAEKGQTLCKEEDKVFLLLHVKNFNRNKKKHNKFKGNRAAIPNYKGKNSETSSSNVSIGANNKVSPEESASAHSSGLLAQFRKLGGLFGNNSISPDHGFESSSSLAPAAAPAAATAPPADGEEAKSGDGDFSESDKVCDSTRVAEAV